MKQKSGTAGNEKIYIKKGATPISQSKQKINEKKMEFNTNRGKISTMLYKINKILRRLCRRALFLANY